MALKNAFWENDFWQIESIWINVIGMTFYVQITKKDITNVVFTFKVMILF